MTYAYGATIKHEYAGNLIKIWLTFRHQMLRSSDPTAVPPVYDIMPPLALWIIKADTVLVAATASEWIDEFTLQVTTDTVTTRPAQITVEYKGPNANLAYRWKKQIEPFAPTLSTDLTATLWKTGMILLWSGSVASIPSGFALCNGSNGTPDLREKFVLGAGTTAPGATGGNLTHRHYNNFWISGSLPGGIDIKDDSPNGQFGADVGIQCTGYTDYINHLPPYYALCYIMKL